MYSFFFFSSRRRHTRSDRDWSSDVCSSDLPCSMGTLGRIAHGTSEDVLLRAADVMLKERRKLILVPRETPLNLVHVKNFELLLQAGATILPANPCFYTHPKTIEQVVDTVVARVLDHLGVPQKLMPRWQEEQE